MLSLAVDAPKVSALSGAIASLQSRGVTSLLKQMSIVSIVGHKMRNLVGIAAEIFAALAAAKVQVRSTSRKSSDVAEEVVANREQVCCQSARRTAGDGSRTYRCHENILSWRTRERLCQRTMAVLKTVAGFR